MPSEHIGEIRTGDGRVFSVNIPESEMTGWVTYTSNRTPDDNVVDASISTVETSSGSVVYDDNRPSFIDCARRVGNSDNIPASDTPESINRDDVMCFNGPRDMTELGRFWKQCTNRVDNKVIWKNRKLKKVYHVGVHFTGERLRQVKERLKDDYSSVYPDADHLVVKPYIQGKEKEHLAVIVNGKTVDIFMRFRAKMVSIHTVFGKMMAEGLVDTTNSRTFNRLCIQSTPCLAYTISPAMEFGFTAQRVGSSGRFLSEYNISYFPQSVDRVGRCGNGDWFFMLAGSGYKYRVKGNCVAIPHHVFMECITSELTQEIELTGVDGEERKAFKVNSCYFIKKGDYWFSHETLEFLLHIKPRDIDVFASRNYFKNIERAVTTLFSEEAVIENASQNRIPVNINRWIRGSLGRESYRMCRSGNFDLCGFLAIWAGVSREDLGRFATPYGYSVETGVGLPYLTIQVEGRWENTALARRLMDINDREDGISVQLNLANEAMEAAGLEMRFEIA